MKKTWPLLSRSPVGRKMCQQSKAVPHDQGSNGGMGASAWGLTGEGVVRHIAWGNHESLPRGGRLMRGESLPDGQKKEDVPGRWTKCWGKTSAKKKKNPVGGVKIIQMSDVERKFELE